MSTSVERKVLLDKQKPNPNKYRPSKDLRKRALPNFTVVRKFMAQWLRSRNKMLRKHPLLRKWQKWYDKLIAADTVNYRQHGHCEGAHAAIERMMNWRAQDTSVLEFTKTPCSSMQTGSRVDDEITQLSANNAAYASKLHKFTKWLATSFTQRQWMPLACQVPLWFRRSEQAKPVRTWADLIAFDLVNERYVLVEIKTGYAENYDLERSDPFDIHSQYCARTARNEHQMQLGLMHFAIRQTGFQMPLFSVVVCVNNQECVREPMPLNCMTIGFYQWLTDARGGFEDMRETIVDDRPHKRAKLAKENQVSADQCLISECVALA